MLPVIVIAATLVSDGSVSLEDARAFRIEPDACRCLWLIARDHGHVMRPVIAGGWNNPPEVVAQWEAEVEWRARCWFLLDDVLYCDHLTWQQKMRSLAELKELIGERAYRSGLMPDVTPAYRMPECRR